MTQFGACLRTGRVRLHQQVGTGHLALLYWAGREVDEVNELCHEKSTRRSPTGLHCAPQVLHCPVQKCTLLNCISPAVTEICGIIGGNCRILSMTVRGQVPGRFKSHLTSSTFTQTKGQFLKKSVNIIIIFVKRKFKKYKKWPDSSIFKHYPNSCPLPWKNTNITFLYLVFNIFPKVINM